MNEKTENNTINPVVAVFGATGHTGRFVIAELLRRGMMPIAIARDAKALSAANFPEYEVCRCQATIDDAASLDRALHGAQAVINCAGPFVDTADAIASAALRAGIHYVDVAAEQVITAKTLEKFDEPARKAGVAVVPAMAFYGGFADLMVTSVLDDWVTVDSIEILMGIDSWHPTQGTRNTIARNVVGNLMITGGRLTPVSSSPTPKRWNIPGPLGDQAERLPSFTTISRKLRSARFSTRRHLVQMQPMRWGVRLRASSSKWSSHAATKIDVQSHADATAMPSQLLWHAKQSRVYSRANPLQALTRPAKFSMVKISWRHSALIIRCSKS